MKSLKPCISKTVNFNFTQKHEQQHSTGLELVRCDSHEGSTINKKLKVNQGFVHGKNTNKRKRVEEEEEVGPPSLPKDVIVSILLLFPAKVLKDNMGLICWEWHNIIKDPDFIRTHFQLSSSGILVLDRAREQRWGLYIERKGIELSLTEWKLPFPAEILGSCHGTVLLHDQTNEKLFHLVTLVSKSILTLPWVPVLPLKQQIATLAIASSGHYKVVHVSGSLNKRPEVMVYTVGIDKAWRQVDLECFFCTGQETIVKALFYPPFSSTDFVYWWHPSLPFGFALDVNSEKMYKFTLPESYTCPRTIYYSTLINLESGLGFTGYNDDKRVWEIFELTDLKFSIWTKFSEINYSFLGCELERMLYPRRCIVAKALLFMKNGDFWFFCIINGDLNLVCFNQKHGCLLPCQMVRMKSYDLPYVHVNSLLSLRNY